MKKLFFLTLSIFFARAVLAPIDFVRAADTSSCNAILSSAPGSALDNCNKTCVPPTYATDSAILDCKNACEISTQASYKACVDGINAAAAASSTTSTTTLATPTASATTTTVTPVTLVNPLGVTDPRLIIGNIIGAILSVIGSITLLMFVYGGIIWITSMGDDKKVMKGKQILIWTVAGLAIIAGAYVLTYAVIQGLTTGSVTP